MKHNLLKSVIISVILLMGVSNAWGWNPVYLIGDPTNNWSNNKTSYVISNNQDAGSAYCYFSKNNSFAVYITYYNEQAGPSSNGAEMSSGTGDQKFFIWDDGANSHAAKYVGNNGIIEIHAQQKDNGDDQPWIWLTRPEIYIRHNWSGNGWSNEQMSDNQNGTYQYIGFYSGANSTNIGPCSNCTDGSSTFKYFSSATLVGTPQKGQKCIFEYNASGYKGFGTQTSNTGSLTITRLYTITYNGNGHTGDPAPEAVDKKHGTSITLSSSIPTRTGYTFAGWNTKADGSGTNYAKGATYSANADVTLYAKWTANTYTVTFNKQSGTGGTNSVTATYNAAMPSATMPTRTGYTFNGYFDATSGGTKYYNANGTSARTWNKTAATTLYAQWTENKYNIVISTDGNGTTNQTGTKSIGIVGISITATPKIGSAFKQWEVTGGAKVANATSATTTITATSAGTVKAVFEEKFTTIYLEPTGHWNSDNPQYVAHVWNGSGDEKDIIMKGVGEAPYKYYKAEVPYGYTDVVFFRNSPDGKTLWNKTGDLTIPTDNNVLYTITSAGKGQAEGYNPAASGVWKAPNLIYTITLGYCDFGTYGIKYNGQSYFSKPNENVTINVPAGAQIEILEGQPFNNAYRGDVIKAKPTSATLSSGQKLTVNGDIMLDDNFVTKESHVVYLGVPESYAKWNTTEINNGTQTYYIWRKTSTGALNMNAGDAGEHVFDKDGIKYYKFTIAAGCNNFCFQRKATVTNGNYATTTFQETQNLLFQIPLTEVNCYTLTNDNSGTWGILPAQAGDYRLLYVEQVVEKDANGNTIIITRKKAHPSDIIRKGTDRKIVSLHTYKERTYTANAGGGLTYTSSNNPEIILQKYLGKDQFGKDQWEDVECQMVYGPLETLPIMANLPGRKNASPGSDIDDLKYHNGIEIIKKDLMPNGEPHPDQGNGVWNFVVTQDNAGNASVQWNQTHRYTGEYYIRTNAAFGEWNSYKGSDNHMTRSDVSKRNSNYSHYYCKWIDQEGTNVTYTIANDYGMAISDTLTADETDIWGTPIADAKKIVTDGTLPTNNEYRGANVRFSWNEKSNFLHRAYLAGSTNVANRFLVLEGKSDQLYNAEGESLTQGANYSDRFGLNANEEIFNDISNWVYYADVQMIPNADLKVTAQYTNGTEPKVQYFVGQAGDNYNNTILAGTGTQKYLIRLLYDFKTNELISAYVPGGNSTIEPIQTNLMLLRKENETPRQLSFTTNKMSDVGKQAYGVLELTKATLIDNTLGKNIYERSLYWISFPFDVRITDIFGFGEYGKHWIIQSYDGAKRAREGLWADSETNWVYHFDPNTLNAGTPDQGIMKRGVGYVVALNLKNIQAETPFVGRITTIALYFPSTTTITGHIVNTNTVSISVPKHECTINRPTPDGDRRVKDSHWNVIGVPSYINAVGDFIGKISAIAEDVKFYYRWLSDYDKYKVVSGKSGVSFNSLNAYMVQFAGNLQWTNVLNEAPAGMAAKRNSDNMQEHHLRLELQQNGNEQDRTFIQLQEDEVTTAFDFNYDLCKIINKGANIYSLIATDRDPIEVAGNVLPVGEAIIPLGIKTDAAGEYTFAMPDGTDGIVVELIDYETNTRTNMLLDNYTINLGKGTFDNRFALHVKPDKTTTSVDNIGNEATGDKVKKYLIDGVLYMQKDGALYDAQGRKL